MDLIENRIDYKNAISEQGFYKDSIIVLEGAIIKLISKLDIIRRYRNHYNEKDPVAYYKARIKTAESMKEKLKRCGYPVTMEAALSKVHDAAGVRVICPFVDDVYYIVDMLKKQPDIKIVAEKDYIRRPKSNGYRSFHLITEVMFHLTDKVKTAYCEVQLRTIAMDCWASLEHQLKYKKNIQNQEMLVLELKRCADEIASTDLNLQTIRDMIEEENGNI